MKAVNLSERDRALLKVCANQGKGRDEDLFAYIKAGEKLKLSSIPGILTECDREKVERYELEDAEFAFVQKLFKSIADWPYAWAEDYVALKGRLEAAEDVKD
jgi:hypothetical protein